MLPKTFAVYSCPWPCKENHISIIGQSWIINSCYCAQKRVERKMGPSFQVRNNQETNQAVQRLSSYHALADSYALYGFLKMISLAIRRASVVLNDGYFPSLGSNCADENDFNNWHSIAFFSIYWAESEVFSRTHHDRVDPETDGDYGDVIAMKLITLIDFFENVVLFQVCFSHDTGLPNNQQIEFLCHYLVYIWTFC